MSEMNAENFAVFTVTNIAYLPKALALAESLLKYDKLKLHIFLIDKKIDINLPGSDAKFIWIEDVGFPDFLELAFKYDITEFSTSLKPGLALKLLEMHSKVIFLDPDTCLYHSVNPILEDLNSHPIVLTPHYTKPHSNDLPDSDIAMMRFGSFNLGFFAIRKSEAGLNFLKWWDDRCQRFCYFETQFGLSTDQKWVSIAPCFFEDLYISFNLGYNVAFWNLHERQISKNIDGYFFVNKKYPLIFFHFSSFDESKPELLSTRPFIKSANLNETLVELSIGYRDTLRINKKNVPTVKYAFDYMSNGDYISPTLRRAYACVIDELPKNVDPFDSTGAVGFFAEKNHLISKTQKIYSPEGASNMNSHNNSFYFVNMAMRLILRILGPNKFANFSRLLVYLSSYRQNRGLWKI